MTKELIISKHLAKMDEKSLKKFKMALCQMKPPPGAGCIKMENLKDKSIKEIVGFIFRCHTEIHGAATIKKTLKEICENQIRMLIEKDIRNGGYTIMSYNIFYIRVAMNVSIPSLILQPGATVGQSWRHLCWYMNNKSFPRVGITPYLNQSFSLPAWNLICGKAIASFLLLIKSSVLASLSLIIGKQVQKRQ